MFLGLNIKLLKLDKAVSRLGFTISREYITLAELKRFGTIFSLLDNIKDKV